MKVKIIFSKILFLILFILFESCSNLLTLETNIEQRIYLKTEELKLLLHEKKIYFNIPNNSQIVDYQIEPQKKKLVINFNKNFSYMAFRENNVKNIYNNVKSYFGDYLEGYSLSIRTLNIPIEELIPNYFKYETEIDSTRIFSWGDKEERSSIVSNTSKPFSIKKGLQNKNIALWHSHGLYYNHFHDRWMFQRARLFQTIEDLGTMAFTLPYLIPMLENSGCNVFVPRERDVQLNEVIVDDEGSDKSIKFYDGQNIVWTHNDENGFSDRVFPLKENINPFNSGGYSYINSSDSDSASVVYKPYIPESGEYSVNISYKSFNNSSSNVLYTLYHSGGKTDFVINQKIGGGTWIYLGTFHFTKGSDSKKAALQISNISADPNSIITTDAVRFGGGVGVVVRNGKTSGKPKYLEGARYYMQFAGINDSLVYSLNGDTVDYKDDYQSRGEWVNYLVGNPFGPNKNKNIKGLGIPIDLSIALHTDAGISTSDTTIGTLAIYSQTSLDSSITFPNNVSRLANRDFTDIVQSQLVDDIRKKYDPVWRRRDLRDARYSEAARPNVPSTLIELLSHQNFLDNIFQLDPRFRFDVSRSIYKAVLKFISFQNGYDYVVQPLAPTHFSALLNDKGHIKLNWRPRLDPLEKTANPKGFIVYTKIGENGFDNGIYVDDTTYIVKSLKVGTIYSFKVTSVNDGGESFPTEILSVCNMNTNQKTVLIVNGFDRISGPSYIDQKDFKGFMPLIDAGVPYKYDISFTGIQHNFDPKRYWMSDDMPGHGASYANYENSIIAGNTFDFSYLHGKTISNAGYSFCSVSDESVWDGDIKLNEFSLVDLIMGEERETDWPKSYTDSLIGKQFKTFPTKLKMVIKNYLLSGGNIFLSGSYIGSDLFLNGNASDIDFAKNLLKFRLVTNNAVKGGEVYSNISSIFNKGLELKFNTELNPDIYAVESPDAIGPINGSETILRYSENDTSAGIGYKDKYGVIALGFPFESILDHQDRNIFMKNILTYLLGKNN